MDAESYCCTATSSVPVSVRTRETSTLHTGTGVTTSRRAGSARKVRTTMSRFHQRLRKHLDNEEFAAGYREMSAELELIQAIEATREKLHVSKEELAARMNKRREAVSRVLTADDANPTLD